MAVITQLYMAHNVWQNKKEILSNWKPQKLIFWDQLKSEVEGT